MKLLYTFLLQIICLGTFAQTFEKYIKHPNEEFPMWTSIELPSEQYLIGVHSIDFTRGPVSKTYLYRLDNQGNLLDSLEVGFEVSAFTLHKGEIYFVGTKKDSLGKLLLLSGNIQYKNSLDTANVKTHIFHQYYNLLHRNLRYLSYCNCFTATGIITMNPDPKSQKGHIVQLDSNMDFMQEKSYSTFEDIFYPIPFFYDVVESLDTTGFYVLTESALDSSDNWQESSAHLVLIDSLLSRDSINPTTLLTDSFYVDHNEYVPMSGQTFSGIQLTDTSYLFAGMALIMIFKNDRWLPSYYEEDMVYGVLDRDMKPIKWQFYGKQNDTTDVSVAKIDKMGKYVFLGSTSDFLPGLYYDYDNFIGLTKLDLQGNLLWTKYYQNDNYNYLFTVTATTDGGALMLGTSFDVDKGTGNESDVYILKVDSNGNLLSTGIEESANISPNNFAVYPNPTSGELNFKKFNNFPAYEVRIFDTMGRQVMIFNWLEDQKNMDLQHLDAGVYFFKLVDKEGRQGQGKIVKQ